MKHNYFKHLFTTLLLLCTTVATAHDFEVGGIYYKRTADGAIVTFAGSSYSEVANEYSGDIIIPSTVLYNGIKYNVISINSNAFRDCANLTSIIIGDNVTQIFDNAFRGCNNLKKVSLGKNVNNIYSSAFYYCTSITSVHYNCKNVSGCEIDIASVKEITFGDNVENVSKFTSTGWYKEQPNGLLYLDNWFIGYKGSAPTGEIVIADGTTHIDGEALMYNQSITSVFIPQSVKYIGNYFLRECNGLTTLSVDLDNPIYDSRENCNAIIETGTNTIIKACVNTTIPNTVKSIGVVSFEGLGVVEIEIPDNVTDIAENAFSSCNNLRTVVIGNGVTLIGDYAFNGCGALDCLKLGDNVETIGTGAFQYCTSLADVKLPNSLLRIKQYAFNGTKWYNDQTDYPYMLDGWILYDNTTYPSMEDVRGVADRVYAGHSLYGQDLKFTNSVVAIGEYAFNSSELNSVLLPASIVYIGSGAFYGNRFRDVSIPNSLKSISSDTFMWCEYLKKIVIPKSVTNIESGAFYCSSNIEELYVLAVTPPVVAEGGYPVFDSGVCSKATLYVPIGSKKSYQLSSVWKEFENIVEIETKYNISFVIDGEVIASDILSIGEIITSPTDIPQKEGYSFSWNSCPSTMPAKDVVVEGGYEIKTYYISCNVDGTIYRRIGFKYGADVILEDAPEKEGYVFSHWEGIPQTMPAENIEIVAVYNKIPTEFLLTVTSAGYATLYLDKAVEIPIDVEVYTANAVDGEYLKMQLVENIIPANTGVIIKADADTYIFPYVDYEVPAISNNLLNGTIVNEYINVPTGSNAYVLSIVDGEVGMYLAELIDSRFLNNANKAYLQLSSNGLNIYDDKVIDTSAGGQLSNGFRFDFGGITIVDDVKTEIGEINAIYDLQGRKVTNPTNGIYIVNGKKVLIK